MELVARERMGPGMNSVDNISLPIVHASWCWFCGYWMVKLREEKKMGKVMMKGR